MNGIESFINPIVSTSGQRRCKDYTRIEKSQKGKITLTVNDRGMMRASGSIVIRNKARHNLN